MGNFASINVILFLEFGDYKSSSEKNKSLMVLTLIVVLVVTDVAIILYHLVRFRKMKRENPNLRLLDCFYVSDVVLWWIAHSYLLSRRVAAPLTTRCANKRPAATASTTPAAVIMPSTTALTAVRVWLCVAVVS